MPFTVGVCLTSAPSERQGPGRTPPNETRLALWRARVRTSASMSSVPYGAMIHIIPT